MEIVHPVPWFPAWGVTFSTPIENVDTLISIFNKWRPSERWLLLAYEVASSEVHLWTTWYALRRRENLSGMTARTPDVEFLRLISGTHQIKSGFERAGLRKGDFSAWILYLPDEGKTKEFGEIKIKRDSYNDKNDEARIISDNIGAKSMSKRPIPTKEGLLRLGVEVFYQDLTISEIEEVFLSHMALSDF